MFFFVTLILILNFRGVTMNSIDFKKSIFILSTLGNLIVEFIEFFFPI